MPGSKVQDFKKRLYVFTLSFIKVLDEVKYDSVSKTLCNQLLRSGTSIIANYVEGQSGSSKKDFINFLSMALKSANESKLCYLYLKTPKEFQKKIIQP